MTHTQEQAQVLLQELMFELGLPDDQTTIDASLILANFKSKPVPERFVQNVVLGFQSWDCESLGNYGADILFMAYRSGFAISDYIDRQLAQEHPTDKRYLLRYLEQLCDRYGKNSFVATGFGHDVIYSRVPLTENYKVFDNTLYVPPTKGYWAIVSKSATR